jgi:hypothetical protein
MEPHPSPQPAHSETVRAGAEIPARQRRRGSTDGGQGCVGLLHPWYPRPSCAWPQSRASLAHLPHDPAARRSPPRHRRPSAGTGPRSWRAGSVASPRRSCNGPRRKPRPPKRGPARWRRALSCRSGTCSRIPTARSQANGEHSLQTLEKNTHEPPQTLALRMRRSAELHTTRWSARHPRPPPHRACCSSSTRTRAGSSPPRVPRRPRARLPRRGCGRHDQARWRDRREILELRLVLSMDLLQDVGTAVSVPGSSESRRRAR